MLLGTRALMMPMSLSMYKLRSLSVTKRYYMMGKGTRLFSVHYDIYNNQNIVTYGLVS
jgi:hypothetical protein